MENKFNEQFDMLLMCCMIALYSCKRSRYTLDVLYDRPCTRVQGPGTMLIHYDADGVRKYARKTSYSLC